MPPKYMSSLNGVKEAGLSISQIIPIIDRIVCLTHKAASNKALCEFIGERLSYAKSILKDSDSIDSIDYKAVKDYYDVLCDIEKDISLISRTKHGFKVWVLANKIVNAKEAEGKLVLLYKRLEAANNDLFFSVLKSTHQNVTKEIPNQLQKIIQILTITLEIDDQGIDGWKKNDSKMDDVILDNKKIRELRNQPEVIRGKIVKKKYLTQDVAQKPIDFCDSNSCKIINMLKLLADCKNVMKFFGVYRLNGKQYLITEWCEHGNLEEYLFRNLDLDWNVKVNIATGIANGLVFCHDRDILHHDIRSSNIMLDAYLCAKLSNFESSRMEQEDTMPSLPLMDIARYKAPEKFKKENPYTKECDIFSLGIVLWVIAMQKMPYESIHNLNQVEDFVIKGNRPELVDKKIPTRYKEIMKEAWNHEIKCRPDASEMYQYLTRCLVEDEVDIVKDEPENLVPISDNNDAQRDEATMYEQAVVYHSSHNREKAFSIFYELALAGHKESLFYLGYYYENGYVVSQDSKKALKYYRESADKDCNRAAYYYAEICLKLAHEYMEKAAQLGQFKAGIKLAEYNLPQLSLPDECDKLLKYLDADDAELQRRQPKDLVKYQERIEGLRNEIGKKFTN